MSAAYAIYKSKKLVLSCCIALLIAFTNDLPTFAQEMATIAGNHPEAAETEVASGPKADGDQLAMAITLKLRDPQGAKALLAQIQDPNSPNYHQWLTPDQFAAQFDPTQPDVDAVTSWLAGEGFSVTSASSSGRLIRFTGTVAQARKTFGTAIYNFPGNGIFGNLADPRIPARLADVIGEIHGLDNMRGVHADSPLMPRVANSASGLKTTVGSYPADAGAKPRVYASVTRDDTATDGTTASPNASVGGLNSFGPADFQTFFDSAPLVTAGISGGGGDCIAIVGDSDFEQSAVDSFDSSFGQAPAEITTVVVDGSDPGFNTDEIESLLDLEWSHAVAPGAATRYYLANSGAAVIAPIVDQISAAVNDDECGVISVSFTICGEAASFYTSTVSPIYQQAALQGQSILVSSGDQGAAGLIFKAKQGGCVTGTSRNVSELAADPNITAVGGASFDPTYDGSGDDTSVVTSTPLRVWNDRNDGIPTGGASGGGASSDYGKPSYQTGLGVPNDQKRDLPDVALFASPFFPGAFVYVDSSCLAGGCDGSGAPTAMPVGGTSLAAPSWAGIAKLVAQQNKVVRLGSLNPKIYQLANSTIHSTIFQDVTTGNNNFNKVNGYAATPGFDLATGWGLVDVNALANSYFANVTPLGPQVISVSPAPLAFGEVDFAVAGAASTVKKLAITNPKKYQATLEIDSITGSAGFSPDPSCSNVTAAPGQKFVCNITYTPTAFGAANGTITITSNAATSPQLIPATGSGVLGSLKVSPGSLNFGKVPLNTTSAVKSVTLHNDSGATFTITSITNGNPVFSVSQSCVGPLGSGGCAVAVSFTPNSTTKATDTLTITDAPDGLTKTVSLSGNGQ
jgi:subtilase family serine protease